MEPIYFSEVRINGRRVLALERYSAAAEPDIIEEFIIDGPHEEEWPIGSEVVVSVAGEMIIGKVTAVVPYHDPLRTGILVYHKKIA